MPRLVKRLLFFLVLPGVLLSGAIVIAGWLALRQFTPERLVRQLETTCNARVQMEGCTLSLFSSPARLELTGLQFHPRDGEADRGTPMASRPPIKITHTYLRMRRALIEADLLALLLRRELRVKTVRIDMGDIKCDILPGGGNSLRALFTPPSTVPAHSTPAMLGLASAAAAVAATTNAVHSTPPADEAEDASSQPNEDTTPPLSTRSVFAATQLPGIVALDSIVFADSRIRIRNRKTRAVTELNELQFNLTDVAVDPADLTTTNRGTVSMTTRIVMTGSKKKTRPRGHTGPAPQRDTDPVRQDQRPVPTRPPVHHRHHQGLSARIHSSLGKNREKHGPRPPRWLKNRTTGKTGPPCCRQPTDHALSGRPTDLDPAGHA